RGSRICFLFIRAQIFYFGFLTPYCRVDLERYERSPSKPYIRLSSNTAFHRILYVSMKSSMEFCLLTFKLSIRFPPFPARIGNPVFYISIRLSPWVSEIV